MPQFILQAQMLLTALSIALPLAPPARREALAHVLETIAGALRVVEVAGDVAEKFAALRAQVEAIAANGGSIDAETIEAAFDRVRAASAAFRTALTESASA